MLVATFVDGVRKDYDEWHVKMAAMNRVVDEARESGKDWQDMPDTIVECFCEAGRTRFLFRVFREVRYELKLMIEPRESK